MFVRPRRALVLSSALLLTTLTFSASGTKPAVNKTGGDLAARGYDVVAYSVAGVATKGNARFRHRWNEATWEFANADNRARFARTPEKYAPQFGGYCAWAVSRGYTADADPEAWQIVEGKLYLTYSKAVQRRWEQDIAGNIARARANWPAVLDK
jgi:hypothetical protein